MNGAALSVSQHTVHVREVLPQQALASGLGVLCMFVSLCAFGVTLVGNDYYSIIYIQHVKHKAYTAQV